MVVSQYIDRPLLINGYKFDLRVYVAITCYNPLRAYVYEEGMGRFATMKYNASKNSRYKHLTNFSINKKNSSFVASDVAEDSSNWTMTVIMDHLDQAGIDVKMIKAQINDIIVKSLISIDSIVNSCIDMYVPHSTNCFDLLGYDILIDEDFKPWLIEVNMSPSMSIESDMDHKIKAPLMADLFTLLGVVRNSF